MNTQPLTQDQIDNLTKERRQMLSSLKPLISRKMYFTMEEKLEKEEKALNEILDWQEGRQSQLSRYTLILDPHYFEQEFFN